MADRTLVSFDYAIKNILRDKSDFGILSGFLTELIGQKVTVIEILESEGNAERLDGKVNRVDLKAKIKGGEIAVFEIQFSDEADFFGKIIYDACKAVVEQISSGGKYDIKKVYSVNIAYFNVGAKRDYVFTARVSNFTGIHFNEKISFSKKRELEPPALGSDIHPEFYLILPNNFDERIRGKFDEWVYLLKKSAVKKEFSAAGIKKAAERLDFLKMTPTERRAYERFLDNKTSIQSAFETAWDNGMAKGMAEGRAEADEKWRTVVAEKDAALTAALAEIKKLKNAKAKFR